MKKLFVLMLSLMVIFSLATACTKEEGPKDNVLSFAQGKPEIDGALKEYAAAYEQATGTKVNVISCGGDSCALGEVLRADYAAGTMPDIFQIQGIEDYKEWKDIILVLDGEKWVGDTAASFKVDGKVVGFPVAVEGWGMAYNKDMLDKAGIDPATLTNFAAYEAAFAKLDSMKAELGIDAVVSMAAGPQMGWVVTDHNLNTLLSGGLPNGDMSITNDLLAGKVDRERMTQYCKWVALLFKYADKTVLTTGDYNAQVGAWTSGKAVFLHQGNWVDGNVADSGASFNMGFAPHGAFTYDTKGIFIAAPSYYVINKNGNVAAAKKFLNDLVYTELGNKYMVEGAGSIPAFKNITLNPSGKLSTSVKQWAAEGEIYGWYQYNFAGEFKAELHPIYGAFANGSISFDEFVEQMINAFEGLAK